MKRYCFAAVLVMACAAANSVMAQYTEDFRAREVLEKRYTDIKGSAFLSDDWLPGLVKLADGTTYGDVPLKFDQVANELMFRNKEGEARAFADPVAEFMINDGDTRRLFRNGFKAMEGNSESFFYEVLYDGGTLLLKDPKKNIVEHRSYNSSTTVKSIVETPAYYLVLNGQPVKIKKDKKAVLSVLRTNTAEMEEYIRDKKLNLRNDADLASLIQFYDSVKG